MKRARRKSPAKRCPTPPPQPNSGIRLLPYAFFFLSGAAGLIYEVVWVRQLTLILGASTYAVTIILAAFMTGLGIGSWVIGRLADRFGPRRLAWTYVALEAGVGVYALLLPALLRLEESVYIAVYQSIEPSLFASYAVRLLLAFITFATPTSLMGATLPVLARYVTQSAGSTHRTVSRLYAANTLGAVAGTLVAGYVLLSALGNAATILVAASANLFVALGFLWYHRHFAAFIPPVSRPIDAPKETPPLTRLQVATIAAFSASGAAAMVYEVVWTRSLSMVLGTTTFAFTAMLATFLLGIGLGSAGYSRLRKMASAPTLFVLLEYSVAISAALSLVLFNRLPFLYLSLTSVLGQAWGQLQVLRFALASLVMLVPTLAFGAIFPAVSEILVAQSQSLGSRLGRAAGLNTFGSVVGAVSAGLVLIPWIGLEWSLFVGVALNTIAGSAVLLLHSGSRRSLRLAPAFLTAALVAAIALGAGRWTPGVLNSGVYVYASRYHDMLDRVESSQDTPEALRDASSWTLWRLAMNQYTPLFCETGPASTVSVMQRGDGVRFLTVDGKTDASTSLDHDMKTQVLLGQLPLLYHKNPDKVFIVGLGSGITAGSVLTHPVRLVDCAEFSPAVIAAARYFDETNHHALDDSRLHIIKRDARNHLLVSNDRYDVIISQPSNPWISGQSSLFTREWYQLVYRRLAPGGIFAQWVPTYCMSEKDVLIIINTLRSVFPNATVWTSGAAGDLIFLAPRDTSLRIAYDQFRARVEGSAVHADIVRLGVNPLLVPFESFVMSETDLTTFLWRTQRGNIRYNTDDLLITEFSTPKQLVRQHASTLLAAAGDMRSLVPMMTHINANRLSQELIN